MDNEEYFTPSEREGGWRVGDPKSLGVDIGKLNDAMRYYDRSTLTKSHGGALVIVYRGHVIGESYTTGYRTSGRAYRGIRSCSEITT